MIAFTRANTYFKQLNTELLGLSVDSNSSHLAWQKLPTNKKSKQSPVKNIVTIVLNNITTYDINIT